MKIKTLSRREWLFIAISGILIFTGLVFTVSDNSSSKTAGEDTQAGFVSALVVDNPEMVGKPVRLEIPKINVDAVVDYVGLDTKGAMAVPKKPENVGWFELGARPGENGSAVIAGHYGWKDNVQAVFDNLNKLEKGDQIYVTDEKNITIAFTVRESRSYGPTDDASEVFNFDDGVPHLNLITCEGIWNKITKTYSQRLVIFTDRE